MCFEKSLCDQVSLVAMSMVALLVVLVDPVASLYSQGFASTMV